MAGWQALEQQGYRQLGGRILHRTPTLRKTFNGLNWFGLTQYQAVFTHRISKHALLCPLLLQSIPADFSPVDP